MDIFDTEDRGHFEMLRLLKRLIPTERLQMVVKAVDGRTCRQVSCSPMEHVRPVLAQLFVAHLPTEFGAGGWDKRSTQR